MKERLFIFMENKELSTIQALKNLAMQNSMRTNDFSNFNIKTNSSLAMAFYYFLVGKTNKLPTYDSIQKIINSELSKINIQSYEKPIQVSMACGIIVYYNKIQRSLIIEQETPIKPITSRYDTINENTYKAKIVKVINEYYDAKEIDINKEPLFDHKRTEIFQKYLKGYRLQYSSQVSENNFKSPLPNNTSYNNPIKR